MAFNIIVVVTYNTPQSSVTDSEETNKQYCNSTLNNSG